MHLRKRDVVLISQGTDVSDEGFQRATLALGGDVLINPALGGFGFCFRQPLFPQGVIAGIHFNRSQCDNFALKNKADIRALNGLF
jgi:hypothetical protein